MDSQPSHVHGLLSSSCKGVNNLATFCNFDVKMKKGIFFVGEEASLRTAVLHPVVPLLELSDCC